MPKYCPQKSESSSSSSESLPELPCRQLCPQNIYEIFSGAVVDICSETILFNPLIGSQAAPITPIGSGIINYTNPDGTTTLNSVNRRTDVFRYGNGFIYPGNYVICPASLVLVPPSLNGVAKRFPFVKGASLTAGPMQSQMTSASRIFATIKNVNGGKITYTYELTIIAVDGAADLAVLYVDPNKSWNSVNKVYPNKDHPYLLMGDSASCKPGEEVYLLGNPNTNPYYPYVPESQCSIVKGTLGSSKAVEAQGWVLPETVVVQASVFSPACGMPILNKYGRVIGMQTTALLGTSKNLVNSAAVGVLIDAVSAQISSQTQTSTTPGVTLSTPILDPFYVANDFGTVMGPSSRFMNYILRIILMDNNCEARHKRLLRVSDFAGGYYSFVKGYAGLALRRMRGDFYDATVDYSLTTGAAEFAQGRVVIDAAGNFLGLPHCKMTAGMQVLGLAGAVNTSHNSSGTGTDGYYFVPGISNLPPVISATSTDLQDSPFLNILSPGDVILAAGTNKNLVQVGCLTNQTALSNITWRMLPNDELKLVYRRGGNFQVSNTTDNTNASNSYDSTYTTNAALVPYPALMDFPWYNNSLFPKLLTTSTTPAYPYFTAYTDAGVTQDLLQQPCAAGANFHPAL
jgi:S1-C subfamily serine protease